ncbi:SusC/RagA family TonB-linked outer membrane protein [Pedobacter sp.]|uniref:SusC/RagA family TonB-linked outer membrane protein n=1 Tax=Pedobacter sp. TaxID=1411316 RepID=UPI002C649801|nr:SusC/RagA family TonB-linked outer membrane protein [Pedobacter sp.]HWW41305.1 SusC/RagA family TonB-linked outer membrane protein [Pedobacter sp.]
MNFSIHRGKGMRIILPKCRSLSRPLVKCIVMAKITILLIALSLQVSANIYAQQQVTLNVKNAPLLDVLSSIREQTGYIYMMRAANSKLAKPVTINLQSVNLETALQQIFLNQPFTFKLESNTIRIVVKPELEKKSSSTSSEEGQQKDINGYVKDEKGNPLQGATIILKEQNNRVTVSDGDGRFSFANAPDQGTILVRMIGRETREIKYQKGNTVSIVLKEVNMKMNEVQIIAYGEVKKTDLTSNISSVKGSVIAQAPVTNMLYALEGRVPGLYIQQTSGVSGNGVNVTIQGINSIANGNIPFYVIDGVPYAQNVIQTNVRQITSGIGNAMGFINPSDIASIEILKDADATAIYGSRAANGAILITTKKGKAGQTKVDVDMQSGWGKVAKKIDLLNTQQYLSLRFEALKNGNRTPGPSDYDINGEWDQTRNTNWQKELIGGTSQYQNMNASVSGGNENTQFMAGTGYLRETTVFPGNFSDSKISFHVNLHHSSKNNRFKFDLSANYLQGTNRLPQADLTSYILTPPDAPALYNSDGTINWAPSKTNPDISTFSNPIASLNQKYTAKTNNLISNGQVSYEIVSDLILKISMGYNRLETNEVSTAPWTSINPSFRSFIPRSANYATSAVESWISEPQLNYSKELSFGHLDALIGGTFQQTNNDMNSIYAEGFANDAQLENLQAAPTVRVTGYLKSIYKYSAIFGRINYKLNDKYILNLTARRDGSSRFGPANLFHNFYAIGGAWIFSNEHFIQKNLPFLNFGKLRLSYGTTGNDQIGEYQFLDLYNNYVVDIPYQNTVALTANGLSNPYLQWEETRKINLGIDLGVLENRIALTANYFRNRSSNQLLGYHVSGVSGFNTIIRNLPATVQNTGWEFLLETTPIRRNKFNWSNSINLTIPKNKLIRYDDLDNNSTFVVGQSLNLFKAYDYAGVNSQTGLYQFINSKGELTSTPDAESDRTVLIDLNPKWYGGFSNTITYQNWNLSFLFQYVKRYNINSRYPLLPGRSSLNTTTNVLNHWKAAGDDAEIQKVTSDFLDVYASATAVNSSNAVYADGSYARLKNLSLSYNFPQAWLSKLHINHARLYAQGQNLLTFTKYFGGDPETSSQLSLPPLRIYTVGLQITL